MAKHFFLKHGFRNRIQYRNGQVIPFEAISDSRGIIVIDDEAKVDHLTEELSAEARVADLNKYIAKRIGGVVKIDEAEYENLKKNHPAPTAEDKLKAKGPRLFVQETNPFSPKGPAQPATVPVAASPAAEQSPAVSARGGAGLDKIPLPVSKGRPAVKTTKGRAAAATPPATVPVAEAEAPVNPPAAPAVTDLTPPVQAASEPSATPATTE